MTGHRGWPTLRTALLVAVLSVSGCPCGGPKPPPPPPPPPVHDLCLQGSPRLNWYDSRPHTVFVRVFQLSSVDAFERTDPGKLLDAQTQLPGAEGPPMERTVYPDSKVNVSVIEQPAAAYVGVVAAFYRLDGIGKAYMAMKGIDGAPCVQLGANAMEPLPVGPQPKPGAQK